MVTVSRINQSFKQQPMSCVLASYAIVSNYYTGVSIQRIFIDYCSHFALPVTNAIDAENVSAWHINFLCPRIGWNGYRMIEWLHNNSVTGVFATNRNTFLVHKQQGAPPDKTQLPSLVEEIRNYDSLINRLIIVTGGAHSQTIGMDNLNQKEFLHDTGNPTRLLYPLSRSINSDIKEYIVFRTVS